MTKRWDGIRPDGSFQTEGMNSFNHYAYGAIGEWLYSYVAGIAIDEQEPGYKHIVIQPHPGGGLTNAKAHIHTMYGKAACSWDILKDEFNLGLIVPPNTCATVTLPNTKIDEINENGISLQNSPGIKNAYQDGKTVVVQLGSGHYHFFYEWKKQ